MDGRSDSGEASAYATAIVVFTDMVGSTALRSEVGDDEADELRRAHDDILRAVTHEHDGVIVKGGGDGFLLRFTAAVEALSAARDAQRRLHEWNAGRSGPQVRIRIGVSAGDVLVEDGDLHGLPVVEAARLEAAAEADEILCSAIVTALAGSRGDFAFEDRGVRELKGITEPVQAYAVGWERSTETARSAPSPLARPDITIGRERLIDALVAGSGTDTLHLVIGEAGGGKTTVLAELVHRLPGQLLFGAGDDVDPEALGPFRNALAPLADSAPAPVADWLRHRAELGAGLGVGTDQTERLARFEAIRLLLEDTATSGPLTLILDDVHWLDDASALLLRNLAVRWPIGTTIVVAYREADIVADSTLGKVLDDVKRRANVVEHRVEALSSAQIGELASRLGLELSPEQLAEVERYAGGTALVVREVLTSAPELDQIPAGLAAFLRRRVDQLPVEAETVLRTAALLPEPVDVALVARIGEGDLGAVLDGLDASVAAGLLVGAPDVGYRFRHALVRDALSSSIPSRALLDLRLACGRALAESGRDPRLVADQYLAAVALGAADAAGEWSERAGARAMTDLAFEQAAHYFSRARTLSANDGTTRRRQVLAQRHGEALAASWQWGAAYEVFDESAALAHELGDVVAEADAAIALFGEPENYVSGVPLPGAVERAIDALGDADPSRAARLLAGPIIAAADADDFERSESLAARAERLAVTDADLAFVKRCRLRSSWDPHRVDERGRIAREVIHIGERTGDAVTAAYGHRWATIVGFDVGALDEIERHLDALDRVAHQESHLFHRWFALTRRAAVAGARGRFDRTEELLTAADELVEMIDTVHVRGFELSAWVNHSILRGVRPPPRLIPAAGSLLEDLWSGREVDTAPYCELLAALSPRGLSSQALAGRAAGLAFSLGDRPLAERHLELVRDRDDGFVSILPAGGFIASVRQTVGVCLLTLERFEEAAEMLAGAVAIERRVGARALAARSGWLHGMALLGLGRDAEAERLQGAARAEADEMGMGSLTPLPA